MYTHSIKNFSVNKYLHKLVIIIVFYLVETAVIGMQSLVLQALGKIPLCFELRLFVHTSVSFCKTIHN